MVDDVKDIAYINERSGDLLSPGDDLKKKVRVRLGHYLSSLTKDPIDGNKYTVPQGSDNITLQDNNGDPTSIQTGEGGETFFTQNQDHPIETYSDSGIFVPTIKDYIKKGKDGHDTLKDIGLNKSGAEERKIEKKISSILRNNRFYPETSAQFIPQSTAASSLGSLMIGKVQKEFGKHNVGDGDIFFDDLRKVGLSLMLKATGEIANDGDPEDVGLAAAALAAP